jgi:hypothetical protein
MTEPRELDLAGGVGEEVVLAGEVLEEGAEGGEVVVLGAEGEGLSVLSAMVVEVSCVALEDRTRDLLRPVKAALVAPAYRSGKRAEGKAPRLDRSVLVELRRRG